MKNFEKLEQTWEDEQLILYDREQEKQEGKEVSDYEHTHC